MDEKLKKGEFGAELVTEVRRSGADIVCEACLAVGVANCCVRRVGAVCLGGEQTTRVTK
jgi:hypothetical protein